MSFFFLPQTAAFNRIFLGNHDCGEFIFKSISKKTGFKPFNVHFSKILHLLDV